MCIVVKLIFIRHVPGTEHALSEMNACGIFLTSSLMSSLQNHPYASSAWVRRKMNATRGLRTGPMPQGLRLSGASSRMTCGASTFEKKLLQIERDRWTVIDVPVTIVSMWNTQRYEKWDLPLSPETVVQLWFLI